MKKITLLLSFLFCITVLSAGDHKSDKAQIEALIQNIKDKYVPDSREAIFDIAFDIEDAKVSFIGVTTVDNAHIELIAEARKIGKLKVEDKIKSLPDVELGDRIYGVINVSVADIRTQNRFTSGMATQSLLGTPIKIFQKDEWYRVQLPDTYFGWAHTKQVVPMTKEEYNIWIEAPKILFSNHYGFAYAEADSNGAIVSDLVAGDLLKFKGVSGEYFKVEYPDGRVAYILRSESQDYAEWLATLTPSAESFVNLAKSMMGIPYVWGGTSTKGMDCSGLVSTVLNMHGIIVLRDASQQAYVGEEIMITKDYDNLQVGDLMFFGTKSTADKKESVRHVGFYLGDKRFLHASGWTRISSLDPADADYDELNTREFIKATRVINSIGTKGIMRVDENPFYQIQK